MAGTKKPKKPAAKHPKPTKKAAPSKAKVSTKAVALPPQPEPVVFAHVGLGAALSAAAPAAVPKVAAVPLATAAPTVATLTASVAKTGGPVTTMLTVGAAGLAPRRFEDDELTPGPATLSLQAGKIYHAVWQGAFVANGRAVLQLDVVDLAGNSLFSAPVEARRPPLGTTFTIAVF